MSEYRYLEFILSAKTPTLFLIVTESCDGEKGWIYLRHDPAISWRVDRSFPYPVVDREVSRCLFEALAINKAPFFDGPAGLVIVTALDK